MERKDLSGQKFTSSCKKHLILAGREGAEVVFEEYCNEESILVFCCDAKLVDGRLYGSNHTAYTLTKKEFIKTIRSFADEQKSDIDTLSAELRKKYYKIPTEFLKLISEAYLKGDLIMNNTISIIAQQFYGNRTATEIEKDAVDAFLLGYTSSADLSLTGESVDRQIIKVPRAGNIVIVYDKNQENEKVAGGYSNNPSCEIPEIGFKIHTRCFACRIDENGELQSLEKGDGEKFIKYFI